MSRSSNDTTRKLTREYKRLLLSTLTAAALSVGFLPAAVHAAGYSYQQHIVNAGILVNGSDPGPYLFYVLNNRPDVKLTDVTLVNPLAPAAANPNTAAYWEVSLNNTSDNQLAQYNVLYLPAGGQGFSPVVNERLRRFVDNGGQLIVEYNGATTAPLPGLFTGTAPGAGNSSSTIDLPVIATPQYLRHPVASQPYLLSFQDVAGLITPPTIVSFNGADTIHSAEYAKLFSPVLVETKGPVVSAAQIGAGQVVVSTLNMGLGISVDPNHTVSGVLTFNQANLYAPTSVSPPNNLQNQTGDLKLLANILAWSEAHPNGDKTSHGNASSNGLASFSSAWQFPVAPSTGTPPPPPAGAAVWGNFVFTVDATGILHAFDAYPSEYLTAPLLTTGLSNDDGLLIDFSIGKSYDEVWNQPISARASAPTLAAFGGVNYVFVEKYDGSVVAYNAVTGMAGPKLTLAGTPGTFAGPVPSPTYYDGRLYVGQADGTMQVYDLSGAASTVTGIPVGLDPNTTITGEFVTGSPSVGTMQDGDSSVIIAVVPTNYNIYTVLLGARDEPLRTFSVNGALTGYSINRRGRYELDNVFADLNAIPAPQAYDYNGNIQTGIPANNLAPSPQDPLFSITNNNGYYTDWNMDFAAAGGTGTVPTPVDLNYVSASSYAKIASPLPANTMSAAAIDRHGDYYYTETLAAGNAVNSYLVGVNNAPLYTNVHLKFRFLMPTTAAPVTADADHVNYQYLNDFRFVGAPVVDDQSNVYVAATDGKKATVLCFRGDQQVSAIAAPNSQPVDLSQVTITQLDEDDGTTENNIQRGPDANLGSASATYGQFTSNITPTTPVGDSISFYNFGKRGNGQQVAGDVTEPQPVTAVDTNTSNTAQLVMRTNLAWYVNPFPLTLVAGTTGFNQIAGLSLVGNGLFLSDGATLYRLSTTPLVGSQKLVSAPPSETPIGTGAAGIGAVGAAPSIGGSVMVINGLNGIAALTRQVTVIADNNRVLGVDGDGSAVWAVDATTRTDLTTNFATKVPFSHPTALSQFALNDYLVADTGNNRCVRFDSAGNVQWELTRFADPQGLMASGQPLTLSQPSSVETRQATIATTSALYPGDAATYYLVADSGNNRVLEVADFVNTTTGALDGNHVLTWVSHTGDRDGRHYRYGSATYFTNTLTNPASLDIAATVTNTRLAPLVQTSPGVFNLGPASGDAPGGSLVVFNYPLTVYPFNAVAPNDLAFTTVGFYAAAIGASGTTYTPFVVRNPRFLKLSAPLTPPAAGSPPFDFLYADDNGAFDLSYDATKNAYIAGPDRLQYVASAYQNMQYQTTGATPTTVYVPAFGVSNTSTTGGVITYTNLRAGLPFLPTCIQALPMDSQPNGASSVQTTRRYLITQNYSQGELGSVYPTTTTGANPTTTNIGKLGGEVFEVDVQATVSTGSTPVVSAPTTVTTPGGFGSNQTLSHPALTGPLTQPTYAIRLP